MKWILLIFSVLFLGAELFAKSFQDGNPVAFEAGYGEAVDLADQGKWGEAHGAWLALLEAHRGQDYVRPHLPDLREAVQRAEFWKQAQSVSPKDVVSGRLQKYGQHDGKIAVLYTPETMQDFRAEEGMLLHPAWMQKKYSLEVKASPVQLSQMSFFLDLGADRAFAVAFGDRPDDALTYRLHTLAEYRRGEWSTLDQAEPRERKAGAHTKPVTVKISVTEASIKVAYNRRQVLSVQREAEGFGSFALMGDALFERLRLQGTVETSWIGGLMDAAYQRQWRAFRTSYQPPEIFQSWASDVQAKRSSRDLDELMGTLEVDGKLSPRQLRAHNRVVNLGNAGRIDEALALLGRLGPGDCTPQMRGRLGLHLCMLRDDLSGALGYATELGQSEDAKLADHLVEVILLARIERLEEAHLRLQPLIETEPLDTTLKVLSSSYLLRLGRLTEAQAGIDAGLAIAPEDEELLGVRARIAKARQGPAWKRTFVDETPHTVVTTDLNRRQAHIVAREAQDTWAALRRRFGPLDEEGERVPIYLFSGEAGYRDYIEDVMDASIENTAGVYSTELKQVLLWNHSNREGMLQTLRHELTHAYLDRALGYVPIWFGEGLAEHVAETVFYQNAEQDGLPDTCSLQTLKRVDLTKFTLPSLLFAADDVFMRQAEFSYPTSWAFVDFLLHTTPENRALYEALWTDLRGLVDPRVSLQRVFGEVDFEALDRDFKAHVAARLREYRL